VTHTVTQLWHNRAIKWVHCRIFITVSTGAKTKHLKSLKKCQGYSSTFCSGLAYIQAYSNWRQ